MAQRMAQRDTHVPERRHELFMFLFLTVLFWPLVTIALVGGFGFAVWIYQIFVGPPGA